MFQWLECHISFGHKSRPRGGCCGTSEALAWSWKRAAQGSERRDNLRVDRGYGDFIITIRRWFSTLFVDNWIHLSDNWWSFPVDSTLVAEHWLLRQSKPEVWKGGWSYQQRLLSEVSCLLGLVSEINSEFNNGGDIISYRIRCRTRRLLTASMAPDTSV